VKFIAGLPVTVIGPDEAKQLPPLPEGYAGQKIMWTCVVDRSVAFELENRRMVRIGPLDDVPLPGGTVRIGVNFGELLPDFERPPATPREAALHKYVIGKTFSGLYLYPLGVAVEIDAGEIELHVSLHGIAIATRKEAAPRPS